MVNIKNICIDLVYQISKLSILFGDFYQSLEFQLLEDQVIYKFKIMKKSFKLNVSKLFLLFGNYFYFRFRDLFFLSIKKNILGEGRFMFYC